jgi:hypothetical protein
MAKGDYIPKADDAKVAWLNNFAGKLPSYVAALNISATDTEFTQKAATLATYALSAVKQVQDFSRSVVAYKDALFEGKTPKNPINLPVSPVFTNVPEAMPEGIFMEVRNIVKRIKASSGYTESIGKDLGIVGEESTKKQSVMQPELKLMQEGGKITVKWKKGDSDGINIYVKRGAGDFAFFAFDAKPHYTDHTALPESPTTWTYRAIYVKADQEIGQFSDEVSINVSKFV